LVKLLAPRSIAGEIGGNVLRWKSEALAKMSVMTWAATGETSQGEKVQPAIPVPSLPKVVRFPLSPPSRIAALFMSPPARSVSVGTPAMLYLPFL
jgi:hypothetical protein